LASTLQKIATGVAMEKIDLSPITSIEAITTLNLRDKFDVDVHRLAVA
jgi:hypothetical protein